MADVGNDPVYRTLKWVAIAMVIGFVGWSAWDTYGARQPGDVAYIDANTSFERGSYEVALELYRRARDQAPDHVHALRGEARTLHMLGRLEEALAAYDEAIAREPDLGATWANRGILLDRIGRHEEALAHYERALDLEPDLADGPHWLTRFLRNQAERPPTIADRAAYLRRQLALPESERVLLIPEIDDAQRPYRM
jgi:tetratricopeptide (TPR) repeat protein